MSAVEAPVVATEAKTEQTQHTRPQRPQYTRSQDVVIPPKPEKVSAPNEEEFKKRVEELETQITAARKRVEDIRGSFSKGTTKDAAFAERTAAREKLQAAQKITRAKGDELNAARAKLKEAQNARDVAIAEETKMKGQMKLTDLKAIERKVAEIDERLTTETLSLPEEKKLIAEREALNATKPMVQALQKKHEDIIAKKKVISEIFDTVKALGEEFNTLKEEEKKLRDSFEAIKARQAESAKEQPSMADELKVAKEKRDLLIASLQAIRDDYHKKAREFRNYERLLRDHQFAKRRKEQLERAEEYKSREEARKAEEASFDPLAAKRELCLTLIASLERMQPDHAARKAEAAALDVSTLPQQLGGKAGHFVVSKKFSQAPIQLLKAKPKAAEKTEEKKPAAEQPLKLPLPLIHQFAELHLSPPATAAAVPATLTQLREKAEYFAAQSAAAAQKAAEAKAAAATAEPVAAAPATEAQDEIPAEPQSMPDVSDS